MLGGETLHMLTVTMTQSDSSFHFLLIEMKMTVALIFF